jgi:hypothetical protein
MERYNNPFSLPSRCTAGTRVVGTARRGHIGAMGGTRQSAVLGRLLRLLIE